MKRILLLAALFACPIVTTSAQNGGGESVNSKIFWDGSAIPDSVFRKIVDECFDTNRGKQSDKAEEEIVSVPPVIFWDGGTIPDPLFRQYVLATFDTDRDGRISQAEADAVTAIRLGETDPETGNLIGFEFTRTGNQLFIWSLKGIEYFPNLKILLAVGHQFCFSELSANTKLEELSSGAVPIRFTSSVLDLSGFKALKKFECGGSIVGITTLDLSANTALTSLDCSWCSLTSLILPKNAPYLTEIYCGGNEITSLDVSGCPALRELSCNDNKQLTSIDLSANTALKKLNFSGSLRLTSLTLPKGAPLTELNCNRCNLYTLDVSGVPALTKLSFYGSKLTSVDLSKNLAIKELNCCDNRITSLDLSKNSALTFIECSYNPLRQLNLSNLAKLEKIYMPEYDPESSLTVTTNSTTKVVSGLAEYMAAQEKHRLQTERVRLENQAREAAKIQAQNRAAENKRQVVAYISRNDWEGADRFAAQALCGMPGGDAYLYFVRAKAYYMRNLDFKNKEDEDVTAYFNAYRQEAQHTVELCNKSINMDKSSGNEAYFIRGLAYIILKIPDNAVADFKRFMSGAPTFKASCYYNIGIAYKNAKRWSEARDNFKLARQYYTDKENVEKCLKKIKACQDKIDGR